jgi:hypothetical protein
VKILYLTDLSPGLPEVDYLPDELYHGLVSVLGPEKIIDCPSKPTYHLARPDGRICRYAIPDLHPAFQPLAAPHEFDLIVVSTPRPMAIDAWLRLRRLGKPMVVVDGQDDPGITDLLLADSLLYFKRELETTLPIRRYPLADGTDSLRLLCHDLAPELIDAWPAIDGMESRLRPISFSVEKEILARQPDKTADLFFAGKITHPHRRAALRHLQRAARTGFDICEGHLGDRDAYLDRLAAARIGLNVRGGGFDCVRYWEIPAVGTVLLSERPTIKIRDNFESGKSALFFNTFSQIIPLAESLLREPERLAAMAEAGREHVRRHHTTEACARYFLDEIENALAQIRRPPPTPVL